MGRNAALARRFGALGEQGTGVRSNRDGTRARGAPPGPVQNLQPLEAAGLLCSSYALLLAASGLAGLTMSCRVCGTTTRSMSSMGMAPSRGCSPMTSAPV